MPTDKPVFNKSDSAKKKIIPSEQQEPRKRKSVDLLDDESSSNDKKSEDPMMVLMGKLQQSVECMNTSVEQSSGMNALKKMSECLAEQAVSALGSFVFDKPNEASLSSDPVKQTVKESRPFNLSPMADSLNEESFLKNADTSLHNHSSRSADIESPDLETLTEFTMS